MRFGLCFLTLFFSILWPSATTSLQVGQENVARSGSSSQCEQQCSEEPSCAGWVLHREGNVSVSCSSLTHRQLRMAMLHSATLPFPTNDSACLGIKTSTLPSPSPKARHKIRVLPTLPLVVTSTTLFNRGIPNFDSWDTKPSTTRSHIPFTISVWVWIRRPPARMHMQGILVTQDLTKMKPLRHLNFTSSRSHAHQSLLPSILVHLPKQPGKFFFSLQRAEHDEGDYLGLWAGRVVYQQWIHLAMTMDEQGKAKFYQDGKYLDYLQVPDLKPSVNESNSPSDPSSQPSIDHLIRCGLWHNSSSETWNAEWFSSPRRNLTNRETTLVAVGSTGHRHQYLEGLVGNLVIDYHYCASAVEIVAHYEAQKEHWMYRSTEDEWSALNQHLIPVKSNLEVKQADTSSQFLQITCQAGQEATYRQCLSCESSFNTLNESFFYQSQKQFAGSDQQTNTTLLWKIVHNWWQSRQQKDTTDKQSCPRLPLGDADKSNQFLESLLLQDYYTAWFNHTANTNLSAEDVQAVKTAWCHRSTLRCLCDQLLSDVQYLRLLKLRWMDPALPIEVTNSYQANARRTVRNVVQGIATVLFTAHDLRENPFVDVTSRLFSEDELDWPRNLEHALAQPFVQLLATLGRERLVPMEEDVEAESRFNRRGSSASTDHVPFRAGYTGQDALHRLKHRSSLVLSAPSTAENVTQVDSCVEQMRDMVQNNQTVPIDLQQLPHCRNLTWDAIDLQLATTSWKIPLSTQLSSSDDEKESSGRHMATIEIPFFADQQLVNDNVTRANGNDVTEEEEDDDESWCRWEAALLLSSVEYTTSLYSVPGSGSKAVQETHWLHRLQPSSPVSSSLSSTGAPHTTTSRVYSIVRTIARTFFMGLDALLDPHQGARADHFASLGGLGKSLGLGEDDLQFWDTYTAAQHGQDPEAMVWLGKQYFWGFNGLPRDQAQAFTWFERAAVEHGHAEAMYNYGIMIMQPDNTNATTNSTIGTGKKTRKRDAREGMTWIYKAAHHPQHPFNFALQALGNHYIHNLLRGREALPPLNVSSNSTVRHGDNGNFTVPWQRNVTRALEYYTKALEKGSQEVMFSIGALLLRDDDTKILTAVDDILEQRLQEIDKQHNRNVNSTLQSDRHAERYLLRMQSSLSFLSCAASHGHVRAESYLAHAFLDQRSWLTPHYLLSLQFHVPAASGQVSNHTNNSSSNVTDSKPALSSWPLAWLWSNDSSWRRANNKMEDTRSLPLRWMKILQNRCPDSVPKSFRSDIKTKPTPRETYRRWWTWIQSSLSSNTTTSVVNNATVTSESQLNDSNNQTAQQNQSISWYTQFFSDLLAPSTTDQAQNEQNIISVLLPRFEEGADAFLSPLEMDLLTKLVKAKNLSHPLSNQLSSLSSMQTYDDPSTSSRHRVYFATDLSSLSANLTRQHFTGLSAGRCAVALPILRQSLERTPRIIALHESASQLFLSALRETKVQSAVTKLQSAYSLWTEASLLGHIPSLLHSLAAARHLHSLTTTQYEVISLTESEYCLSGNSSTAPACFVSFPNMTLPEQEEWTWHVLQQHSSVTAWLRLGYIYKERADEHPRHRVKFMQLATQTMQFAAEQGSLEAHVVLAQWKLESLNNLTTQAASNARFNEQRDLLNDVHSLLNKVYTAETVVSMGTFGWSVWVLRWQVYGWSQLRRGIGVWDSLWSGFMVVW